MAYFCRDSICRSRCISSRSWPYRSCQTSVDVNRILQSGFVRGLLHANRIAVCTAVAVTAIPVISLVALVDEEFYANVLVDYMGGSPSDAYALASATALHMKSDAHDELQVGVISASSLRSALVDEEVLSDVFREYTGRSNEIRYMYGGGMTSWTTAALIDEFAGGMQGLIVVSVGINRLAREEPALHELASNPSLAFRSDFLDDELRTAGVDVAGPTGIYAIDNWRFLIQRSDYVLKRIVTGRRPFSRMLFLGARSPETLARYRARMDSVGRGIYTAASANLDVLTRVIDRHRSPNRRFAIVRPPLNPEYDALAPGRAAYYDSTLAAWARENRLDLWNVHANLEIGGNDYHDLSHLADPEVIDAYQRRFVQLVDSVLTTMELSRP